MADFVATATFQDNLSSGADAATAALNRMADAADKQTAAVTRAGPSADALVRRFDPATVAANKLAKAQNDLAIATATMDAAVASGTKTVDQRNAVVEGAASKVQALTQATANSLPATAAMTDSHGKSAAAAGGAALAHAGFTREIVILGHEVISGNFSRIPGSMVVLAERSGELNNIIKALGGFIFGLPGAALAATAGLAAMGYMAESNERQLLGLQTALRGTRDDFVAMAAEANAAARAVAATSGVSLSDSRASAQTFASVPNFQGSQQQLQALIRESNDLASVMGVTVPEAAAKLAAAIKDPAKAAQEWADSHSFGMTQALADQIKLMQDSGDKAGAFGLELDRVKAKTTGAAEASKTDLQKALENLSTAFTDTEASGRGFAAALGSYVTSSATAAINALAAVVNSFSEVNKQLEQNRIRAAAQGVSSEISGQGDTSGPGAPLGTSIPAIGSRLGVSQSVIDLGTRIATQEGGGVIRHANPDGSPIVSSAGAIGEFQLMPGTAAGLGVDPTDQGQNIAGGLTYIAQLSKKYKGDPALVAMAYNWGPGNVDKFLAGTKSFGDVPKETQSFVQGAAGVSVASIQTHGPVDISSAGIANSSVVDDALKRIGSSTITGQSLSASANIKDDIAALAALSAQGITTGESVTKLNEDLQKQQLALQNAIAPAKALIDSLNRQTDGNNAVAAAYEVSTSAGLHAENELKAQTDARTKAKEGSAQYQAIVVAETAALDNNTKSAQQRAAVTTAADQQQQLQYLSAELSTLGESADVRARDLAVLKERQAIQKSMPDIDAAEKQKLLDNAAAIADATANLQRQQQAAQELGNVLTQAFDQVGSAITQAFVNGNGAAVNFGNVARAVMASVLQEVVKLAIINPILNSVTGGNATTLSGVLGVIGGAGTAASGSSGSAGGTNLGSTLLSGASTASSISGAFGGPTISSSLGLTGPNGVLSGLGSSVGGLFSTGASASTVALSNAPLAAGVAGPVATGGIGEGAGIIGGVQNGVVAGLGTNIGFGSATIGTAFTGVGAGFAAGSLAGGLIQGSLNKTGPAPEIGAAGGAVTGAIIGSVIPVIGTIIGGLIGGIVGGAGGGLIGPHVANPFTVGNITTQNGQLGLTNILSQKEDDQAIKFIQATQAEIQQINALLTANGATVNASGLPASRFEAADTAFNIGNSPNGNLIPTLDAGFSALRFSSTDPDANAALQGRSFIDPTDLQNFFAAQTAFKTFVTSVSDLTKNLGITTGSFTDSVVQLNAAYNADKANADSIIATGKLSADETTRLTAAEQSLSDVRDNSVHQLEASINAQLVATQQGFQSRYLNAAASISGNPADAENAQLYAFDINATAQRQQLDDAMKSIFGDSYATTSQFATESAALESTLGEERLAIQTQYNNQIAQSASQAAAQIAQQMDQARQTATGVVNGIGSYVTQLQGGSASPLSPTAKYGLAGSQFNTAAAAAEHGDATALQGITGFADSFLQSSQAVNGSGLAYVGDFNRVLSVLSDLASQTPDALTAAVYTAETRTQTQTLSDALDSVKAEVVALRLVVAQGSAAPARIG